MLCDRQFALPAVADDIRDAPYYNVQLWQECQHVQRNSKATPQLLQCKEQKGTCKGITKADLKR